MTFERLYVLIIGGYENNYVGFFGKNLTPKKIKKALIYQK